MGIFDTHAHYDSEKFAQDREQILKKVNSDGVELILNPGVDINSSKLSISMAETFDFVYSAVGIHPHEANLDLDNFKELKKLSDHKKVVAIGEIGLDYYYNFKEKEIQKKCFIKQIETAIELNLPIIVHDRDAHSDIYNIVMSREFKDIRCVMHCFSGSLEMAKKYLDRGFYLSFGGVITFKNARKSLEVLEYIPMDLLLIETDAPYLTPVPYRGKRNDSSMLKYVIEKISDIKGLNIKDVTEATMSNGKRFFRIG